MKRHSGLGSLGTVRREMSPHQANHSSSESINICITITGSMLAVMWHRFVCVCLVKKKQTNLYANRFTLDARFFRLFIQHHGQRMGVFLQYPDERFVQKQSLMFSCTPLPSSPFPLLLFLNFWASTSSHFSHHTQKSRWPAVVNH